MPKELPPNVEKWCQALESGEYTQTTGRLKDRLGYCCWGVASDLKGDEDMGYSYPSPELIDWLEIPRLSGPTNDIVGYLADMNDEGNSFTVISEEIRRVFGTEPSTDA